MKRLPLLALPILGMGWVSCSDSCDDCDQDSVPVFFESEPNDAPANADDFGLIHLGDHFFIDGFITDRGTDPFDGFAFTAGEALHVDFQLFIDDPGDDFDVCLYDPLLDQTLACFATGNNPEQGGVDVTAGGFAFQLVVESFRGESSYSLELVVTALVAAQAEGRAAPAARAASSPKLIATGAALDPGRDPAAVRGYSRRAAEPAEKRAEGLQLERWIEIDRRTGFVLETIRVLPRS